MELRELLDDDDLLEEYNISVPLKSRRPDLLLSVNSSITKGEILASMPPKDVADRLLSRFFSNMDMTTGLLIYHVWHSQFAKSY